MSKLPAALLATLLLAIPALAAPPEPTHGDRMLAEYFRSETAALSARCLADVHTIDDWTSRRPEYRRQLAEMLGLWPEPARTDLKPVITGKIDHADFTLEKFQLQSRPGLYVTGDLYLPKNQPKPCPAILYVCGHSLMKKDGISFGNKTFYQHHGEWFARNGYVCLVVDSLQLGEIEGIHHGLYRENMWWWLSRGYTPAGVEAWNGIRCLDYLQTRPEVDPERLGMTGRSGGGATTWYTAALDERIKVVVPVAGITDLQNHIVDGTIEGHCDCMFMTNTYRWDFPQVAALIAPRPMLISNSDKDTIFPLDGVVRLHKQVRNIYQLYNAPGNLGLLITEGPHKDTQDLQVPAFRWFNRFLKADLEPLKDATTPKLFEPAQLRVFTGTEFPADQVNQKIQETFIPVATPPLPPSAQAWNQQRDQWLSDLKTKTFAAWPDAPPSPDVKLAFTASHSGIELAGYDFTSQANVRLRFYVARPEKDARRTAAALRVLDQAEWDQWLSAAQVGFADALAEDLRNSAKAEPDPKAFAALCDSLRESGRALIWFPPRGIGPTAWSGDAKRRTHIERRFALLGQTLEGQRVWDVRRAIEAIRSVDPSPLSLQASNRMAGVALYASLFVPPLQSLELRNLPLSHRQGPDLLNVMKILDLPAAVALAAERTRVRLEQDNIDGWDYPRQVAKTLGWPEHQLDILQNKVP